MLPQFLAFLLLLFLWQSPAAAPAQSKTVPVRTGPAKTAVPANPAAAPSPASASSREMAELGPPLAETYRRWRSSMLRKDLALWKETTAQYRQVMTRNLIVSQKQPFPEAMFQVPLVPPDTASMKLAAIRAGQDVTHAYYFGKIDLGLAPQKAGSPENLLILKFLREPAGWRFDNTQMMNLTGVPKIREAFARNDFSILESPEFAPVDQAPVIPPLCGTPELMALIEVISLGHSCVATLNGFAYTVVEDTGQKNLVIGGLKRGPNVLTIKARLLPPHKMQGKTHLECNVSLIDDNSAERPEKGVFHYEKNMEKDFGNEWSFTIDPTKSAR